MGKEQTKQEDSKMTTGFFLLNRPDEGSLEMEKCKEADSRSGILKSLQCGLESASMWKLQEEITLMDSE
jgi:hypothetical protein